ncbi:MAG TPA: NAD-dependent epimerase/dehydratase family protein [Candidatus Baltobacteraceae bacterium]|jgi:UDP-sulfoquinovose synthase|nr:NAD-dependent epimerase/dehydratase family protein [Candidatus Baltobacteraceae bacterium]
MNILILGADGYLGWPTAMHLSRRGHKVAVMDNFAKRRWETELNVEPLLPICTLHDRVAAWREISGEAMELFVGDLRNYGVVEAVLSKFQPDAIVHYGEQPSAPYSMIDHNRAVFTQVNNVTGTLNVLWAIRAVVPECHLVKLGTMGEYGTPNIDIEEGFIEIEHKGRHDTLPFPCQPGSFYHLSKVHDSHNIRFACKVWKLAATDLHQGVVYGIETDETGLDRRLETSFHYDEVFGTALNRFCVQAVAGIPMSVYGKGGQKRGFLNIRDTLRCVELAIVNPAKAAEYRVFNQFTETFSVIQLAELVVQQAKQLGISATVESLPNPRVELDEHYYNPTHTKLLALGLEPHFLSDVLIDSVLHRVKAQESRIKRGIILPRVKWDGKENEAAEMKLMWAGA